MPEQQFKEGTVINYIFKKPWTKQEDSKLHVTNKLSKYFLQLILLLIFTQLLQLLVLKNTIAVNPSF